MSEIGGQAGTTRVDGNRKQVKYQIMEQWGSQARQDLAAQRSASNTAFSLSGKAVGRRVARSTYT